MTTKKFKFIIAVGAKGYKAVNKMRTGVAAFNKEVGNGHRVMAQAKRQVAGLVGAYLGFNALTNAASIIKDADSAAYSLQASLLAANREFDNVGSLEGWRAALKNIGEQLKIYSQAELKTAAARTVDMTKRLGLSADQMEELIIRTGDLSAGKFSLENGIERVTAALRGEAEASEALGLTLNETYVRSWYEAQGAMQGAWKDLTDLQKAQIRYQVFLEQATPFVGKAAGSLETLGGAYAFVKGKIQDAITENKEMKDVARDLARYISENGEEIGALAASIARWAAETAKWVVENREMIATVGKWSIGVLFLAKAFGTLFAAISGMNAMAVAMTGVRLGTWLMRARTAALLFSAALLPVPVLIGAIVVATIYAAKKIYDLIEAMRLRREEQKLLREAEEYKGIAGRNEDKIIKKLKEISESTGVTVISMKQLDRAVASGRLRFDELTGTWQKGTGEMTAALSKVAGGAESSFEKMEKISGKKLEMMRKQYQHYADEVAKLQDKIAGRERSLAEQLREMARSGMSELGAWRDRKKEAQEYYRAAQKAAKAGDFDNAVKLADKAKDAYAELNTEVKRGDKVLLSQSEALKTAMAGVEKAGQLAIDVLKNQKKEIADAGDALNKLSGGKLAEQSLSELKEKTSELEEKTKDYSNAIGKANDKWAKGFAILEKDGTRTITNLLNELDKLEKDRHMKLYVEQVVEKATGGLVVPGFALGGSPAQLRGAG